MVARVIFMCGPAGSGKSTVARKLEAGGMARLSFDQEAWRRGIREMPLAPDVHQEIEGTLRARLLKLVTTGIDVVLDFSFWSRRSRDDYRDLLNPFGITPETIYLATPREVVLHRVRARSTTSGDDYLLSDTLAQEYFDHFEPPNEDEGPLTVIRLPPDRVPEEPLNVRPDVALLRVAHLRPLSPGTPHARLPPRSRKRGIRENAEPMTFLMGGLCTRPYEVMTALTIGKAPVQRGLSHGHRTQEIN